MPNSKFKFIFILSLMGFLSVSYAQGLVNFLGHWSGTEALESPSIIYENRNISLVITEGGERDGFYVFTSSSDFLFNENLDWAYHYFGFDKETGHILFLRRFITPLGILGYEELAYELTDWSTEYFFASYYSDDGQTDHQIRLDIQLLESIASLPTIIKLGRNFPNPFNPSTTISLSADHDLKGSLVIYDVKGQEVRKLHDGTFNSGISRFTWDGLDHFGGQVSGGIYLCRLILDGIPAQSQKMTLVK